jgi:hypothetical protein
MFEGAIRPRGARQNHFSVTRCGIRLGTKAALVEAGADEWSIYTKGELRLLIAHNRAKPFLPDELCKLHAIKRTFHGRIAP